MKRYSRLLAFQRVAMRLAPSDTGLYVPLIREISGAFFEKLKDKAVCDLCGVMATHECCNGAQKNSSVKIDGERYPTFEAGEPYLALCKDHANKLMAEAEAK